MQGATETTAKAVKWRVQIRPPRPSPEGRVYASEWHDTADHGFKTFDSEEEAQVFAGALACPSRAAPAE